MKRDIFDDIEELSFKDFVEMDISTFYDYIGHIMVDLNFSFHRSIRDVGDYRRIEIWKHTKNLDDYALVWVEIVKPGNDVTRDVSYDVLRTMNDLNMLKLFFFTNGGIDESSRDVLDDKGHFIFTPDNIIETLIAIKKKSELVIKPKIKRKKPKTPSGFVLIKNFLKENKPKEIKTVVPIKLIPEFRDKLIAQFEPIFDLIKTIEEINNIDSEVRKKLKAYQFALLTDLLNVASLDFEDPFGWMKEDLFYMIQNLVLYIGALVEYELEEDMNNYLEEFNKRKNNLYKFEEIIEEIRKKDIERIEIITKQLKKLSKIVIIVSILALIVVFFMK
ncbi:hypothetical protein [Calditerrivibrio nitroreducens]|uniref:Uncharacterized protein n=1 Tax=Calditerrivibrio nitroreducens (strain DSM 19672 / NBRC 101217 / Yu37-1) TaxID=768670 RepID=E4THM5_CALNY|nr:hypothetical protein [Calditerrivibrio nitroreducens]ADR18850.1 hypothetical protein Calni_0939 [Calditerrivibrio nitroreducens DSM 19672]